MNAVLKYPGAKNRLASWISSYIPDHKVYLEPYAGSLAVFFNKEPSSIETINDLDQDVVNYFQVLRDHPKELINILTLTPYSRQEYVSAYENSEEPIEQARRFCIRCWQGFGCGNNYRNGFRSGQQSTSPNPAKAWAELPYTLQLATERLKHAQIEHMDAIALIKRYNTKDVFIYADPPYLPTTRKGYLYKHEMDIENHKVMLKVLKAHPGKVLLSGYENDLYREELHDWRKVSTNTVAEAGNKRTEVLWMNYEADPQMSIFDI